LMKTTILFLKDDNFEIGLTLDMIWNKCWGCLWL
jgi:hypothetical protein